MRLPAKIETDRLIIYPLTNKKYLKDIYENFTPEITEYMFPSPPDDISDTEKFLEDAIKKNREGKDFQIYYTNKSDEFLGGGGLHKINTKTPEFGVWIKKSAHGHGYGREAMQALKDWADKNLDYDYLKYPVDRRNLASRKIPESMGGIIKDEYPKETMSGGTLDCVEYRVYPDQPLR